jgi:hypothetical protein
MPFLSAMVTSCLAFNIKRYVPLYFAERCTWVGTKASVNAAGTRRWRTTHAETATVPSTTAPLKLPGSQLASARCSMSPTFMWSLPCHTCSVPSHSRIHDCFTTACFVSACTKIFSCITMEVVTTTFSGLSPYTETVLRPSQLQAELNTHAIHTRVQQRDDPFAPTVS